MNQACHIGAKALRWAAARTVSVVSPVRSVNVGETTYFIGRTDDYISRELRREGGYHTERIDNAIGILRQHTDGAAGVVLNLGAHVGTALITLFQAGDFKAGLAVEPAPENAELLESNLASNGISHCVRIAQVAVGDEVSRSVLYLSRTNSANHTLCENKLVWNPVRRQTTVDVTTIDRLLVGFDLQPQDVSLVVIDIQGYEQQAMAGGDSLFSFSPPLMMEMDHHYIDNQQKLSGLRRLLERYYSHFFDLDDMKLRRHSISSLEHYFGTFGDYRDLLFLGAASG